MCITVSLWRSQVVHRTFVQFYCGHSPFFSSSTRVEQGSAHQDYSLSRRQATLSSRGLALYALHVHQLVSYTKTYSIINEIIMVIGYALRYPTYVCNHCMTIADRFLKNHRDLL